MNLVVHTAFGAFKVGQEISDQAVIAEILAGPNQRNVNKVIPRPSVKPAPNLLADLLSNFASPNGGVSSTSSISTGLSNTNSSVSSISSGSSTTTSSVSSVSSGLSDGSSSVSSVSSSLSTTTSSVSSISSGLSGTSSTK